MKKRNTPFEEFERMAENLYTNYGDVITDQATFNSAYDVYFYPNEKVINDGFLRDSVFAFIKQKRGVSDKKEVDDMKATYQVARGKNFEYDKKRLAKTVYPKTKKGKVQYVKTGAGRSDLQGLDTPPKPTTKTKTKRDFTAIGKVKRKTVYAYEVTIKRRGKVVKRLRDSKGRFVSKIEK